MESKTERSVSRQVVCAATELPAGSSRIVVAGGRSIGVFNVGGKLYALRNVCPHHAAPLCLGRVGGRMVPSAPHVYEYGDEDTLLRCPWHGYTFRLEDGRCTTKPDALRVRTYRVEVEDGEVVLYA